MIRPLRRFVFCAARLYRLYSRTPVDATVMVQRGPYVEKVKTPEHRPFHRCYDRSFADHLGVDVKRNSDGIRREKSRRESDRPSKSFPVIALGR